MVLEGTPKVEGEETGTEAAAATGDDMELEASHKPKPQKVSIFQSQHINFE